MKTMNRYTDDEQEAFKPRLYKKCELAMMYFPNATKESASRSFRRWLSRCGMMMMELEAAGYDKNRQYLLKPEVEIIVKHLGEPY